MNGFYDEEAADGVQQNNQQQINQVTPQVGADPEHIAGYTPMSQAGEAPSQMAADGSYNDMVFGSMVRRTYQDGNARNPRQEWFRRDAQGNLTRAEMPESERRAQSWGMLAEDKTAQLARDRNLFEMQSKQKQIQMKAEPKRIVGAALATAYNALQSGRGEIKQLKNGHYYRIYSLSGGSINAANNDLMKMGVKNSVTKVYASIQVDQNGDPVKGATPRFDIVRKKDGNIGSKGENILDTRTLSEAQDLYVRGLVDSGSIASTSTADLLATARSRAINEFGGQNPSNWDVGEKLKNAQTARDVQMMEANAKQTTADAQMKEAEAKQREAEGDYELKSSQAKVGGFNPNTGRKGSSGNSESGGLTSKDLINMRDNLSKEFENAKMNFSDEDRKRYAGDAGREKWIRERMPGFNGSGDGKQPSSTDSVIDKAMRKPLNKNAGNTSDMLSKKAKELSAQGVKRGEGESDQAFVSRGLRESNNHGGAVSAPRASSGVSGATAIPVESGADTGTRSSPVANEYKEYVKGKTLQDVATEVAQELVKEKGVRMVNPDGTMANLPEKTKQEIVGQVKNIVSGAVGRDWWDKNVEEWSQGGTYLSTDGIMKKLFSGWNNKQAPLMYNKDAKTSGAVAKMKEKWAKEYDPDLARKLMDSGKSLEDQVADRVWQANAEASMMKQRAKGIKEGAKRVSEQIRSEKNKEVKRADEGAPRKYIPDSEYTLLRDDENEVSDEEYMSGISGQARETWRAVENEGKRIEKMNVDEKEKRRRKQELLDKVMRLLGVKGEVVSTN